MPTAQLFRKAAYGQAVTRAQLNEMWLKDAARFAKRSNVATHKTGCVVVMRNSLVTGGWSHYSEFSLANYRTIHAEIHALLRLDRSPANNPYSIYVVTVSGKAGNYTNAKPCKDCLAVLHEGPFKEVFFTLTHSGSALNKYDRIDLR